MQGLKQTENDSSPVLFLLHSRNSLFELFHKSPSEIEFRFWSQVLYVMMCGVIIVRVSLKFCAKLIHICDYDVIIRFFRCTWEANWCIWVGHRSGGYSDWLRGWEMFDRFFEQWSYIEVKDRVLVVWTRSESFKTSCVVSLFLSCGGLTRGAKGCPCWRCGHWMLPKRVKVYTRGCNAMKSPNFLYSRAKTRKT